MPAATASAPRAARRSRHGFDPNGQPAQIPRSELPELVGLWYRQGQTFGVELEITRDDYDQDLSAPRWAELAEVLRTAVRQVLPNELVATQLTPTYTGIDGGKDHGVWNVERDPTAGWEVTSAVLEGPQGFDQMARVTRALESIGGREGFKVNWRTGTHVHIGWRDDSRSLDIRALKRLIQLVKVLGPGLATLVSPTRIRFFDGRYHMDASNVYCEPMATRFPKAVVDGWTSTDAYGGSWTTREMTSGRFATSH